MPDLRGVARDRLCVAAALSARRSWRGLRDWTGAAAASQPNTGGDRGGGVGAAAGAHELGSAEAEAVLERSEPGRRWPAASTIGAMLAREGLVCARKKRRRVPPYTQPFAAADAPNRVWCADFKGWFRTGDGARIDPLTISDAHSRYLLRCQAVDKTDTARVQAIFEAAFREYGLPEAIRSDNGAPFASRAVPDCRGWRCGG